ncbi:MAG TPA: hypothetical protein VFE91_07235, partial [Nitrososphaerales archaeon]|nr:hypothetical protein [Nitrososphaerales archaeon]
AMETGLRPVMFDLDGSLASSLSGRFRTYDYRSFLYDAFRLEAPESWHSQLAAAAYTLALDLSSEEEAIIDSAMQKVSSDGALLSPVTIRDVMGQVEGFRGFYVDKLSGRIGSLRLFDAADDQSFGALLEGDVIIDFHRAPYPLAGELSACLFVAKVLAMSQVSGTELPPLFITEAHRIFRANPRPDHSNRLLTTLMGVSSSVAFSTNQPSALAPSVLASCHLRLSSIDAVSSQKGSEGLRFIRGTVLLDDLRSGERSWFFPRRIGHKTGEYSQAKPSSYVNPEVTREVLEHAEAFPLSTPESIVQFLTGEFLPADIRAAQATLLARKCLILEPKDTGSGPKVFCLTLTEDGRKLLQELRS